MKRELYQPGRDLYRSQARSAIYRGIDRERFRQDQLHGSSPPRSVDRALTIITEEVGECARAVMDGDRAQLLKELVEVAASAVALIEHLEAGLPL